MAIINLSNASVGIDVIQTTGFGLFRLWIDKGKGKYRTVEITHDELRRLVVMLGSVLGGSQLRPQRGPRGSYKKRNKVSIGYD